MILIAALALGLVGSWVFFPYVSAREVTITVTDKERAPSNKGGHYMVFSKGETFKNEDSWMYFKFNSSDVQGALEMGKTYKVKVYGLRIPLLSKYRNIVKYEEVK